jgi:predicted RNA methylase
LKSRSIAALVIIPRNFSGAFFTMVNNTTQTAFTAAVGQQAIASAGTGSLGVGGAVLGTNVVLAVHGNVTSALQIHRDAGNLNFYFINALNL